MKKVELVNGQFYHIYNRGVDKREIFLKPDYYSRFIKYLFEFNSTSPIENFTRKINSEGGQTSFRSSVTKVPLVDIICFILIPNHFHLIVKQLIHNGISKFMQKLGTGYTMFFNEKNNRSGRLFSSKYKVKLIETDEYLMHLSRYIHLNCVGLIEHGWKKVGIKNWDRVDKFLENYKWSSYLDYMGKFNFPKIINKEPLQVYFKTPIDYKKYIQGWKVNDISILEELLIEEEEI